MTDFAKTGFASPIALQIGCGDCPDRNVRSLATHSLILKRLANLWIGRGNFVPDSPVMGDKYSPRSLSWSLMKLKVL
ncbi:MAG: hypothetical protein RIB93_18095 [Coleofasciculus sp. D1-CHI-01]|uniref:hypothetical protein n=1 Tax=Coleofasciculus sp. D1-CHI-01 TaxID=3068482 RepID=UPI0032FE0F8F